MSNVISVENFFKLTRFSKIIKLMNFEMYHNNLLKICQIPKGENFNKNIDLVSLEKDIDSLIKESQKDENKKLNKFVIDLLIK
jgi:hypothetical protein